MPEKTALQYAIAALRDYPEMFQERTTATLNSDSAISSSEIKNVQQQQQQRIILSQDPQQRVALQQQFAVSVQDSTALQQAVSALSSAGIVQQEGANATDVSSILTSAGGRVLLLSNLQQQQQQQQQQHVEDNEELLQKKTSLAALYCDTGGDIRVPTSALGQWKNIRVNSNLLDESFHMVSMIYLSGLIVLFLFKISVSSQDSHKFSKIKN